mmetsp:Transcript_3475/g.9955  ORF Transcript_3475/g.9955 Transcript_3475/m.9955 type:complete len:320 (-) Transcript_3475:282-1241(-)
MKATLLKTVILCNALFAPSSANFAWCESYLGDWIDCYEDNAEECSECRDDVTNRGAMFFDCLDASAHLCHMESCCPPCNVDSNTTTRWGDWYIQNNMAQLASCIVDSGGCRIANCTVVESSACADDHAAFSDSCRIELPSRLTKEPPRTVRNEGTIYEYSYYSFRQTPRDSASFEEKAIAECATNARSMDQCVSALDGGYVEYYFSSDSSKLNTCRLLHDMWTRCLHGEDCTNQCNTKPDDNCIEYDTSICGKRCCCEDKCGDILEQYETCIQSADSGNCPATKFPCSDRFCLSGAMGLSSMFATAVVLVMVSVVTLFH